MTNWDPMVAMARARVRLGPSGWTSWSARMAAAMLSLGWPRSVLYQTRGIRPGPHQRSQDPLVEDDRSGGWNVGRDGPARQFVPELNAPWSVDEQAGALGGL